MSCERWHEQLIGLLDNELTAGERVALESHLSDCSQCREDLAELRATSAILQRWQPEDPPAEFVFTRRRPRRSWREVLADFGRGALLPAGLGAAAAAVVALLVLPPPDSNVQDLTSEVAQLRERLAAAESVIESGPGLVPVGSTEPVMPPQALAATPVVRLDPGERENLLAAMRDFILESESRQDAKFLFTTDQLARSLSIQRREDLQVFDRRLRDARSETFSALVTTHQRLDRMAAPSLMDPLPSDEGMDEGEDGGELDSGEPWQGPGERLEPE
jgi:hypothetical protein